MKIYLEINEIRGSEFNPLPLQEIVKEVKDKDEALSLYQILKLDVPHVAHIHYCGNLENIPCSRELIEESLN
jgi:hypothetical protein